MNLKIRHSVLFLFVAVLSLGFLSSCSSSKKIAVKKSKPVHLSENDQVNFTYIFYNAEKEKNLGNPQMAIALYLKCLEINPNSAAVMYDLGQIYHGQHDDDNALKYSKQAAQLDPTNKWYQKLYIDCLIAKGDNKDVITEYKQMIKMHPDNMEYYFDLAGVYLEEKQYSNAIDIYNQIEAKTGLDEDVSLQKANLYERIKDYDSAENEVSKLIKAYPDSGKYYGILGDMYEAQGKSNKAFANYQQLLKISPNDPLVHLSLADYYRDQKQDDKAFDELKLAFQNPQLNIDTKIRILLSFYTVSESHPDLTDQAMQLCKILVKVHPDEAKSHAMYGDFLYRENKLKDAQAQYQQAVSHDSSKYAIWSQLLIIDSQLNDYTSMQSESKSAIDLFPTEPLPYLLNGIANIHRKNYKQAIDILNEGMNFVVEDTSTLVQFYSNLGDAYYYRKDTVSSDHAFDLALKLDSNNTYVLNNYSYYLSLRGGNLEKAKIMALKANKLAPNTNSFEDTYGWILFKMGQYKEAEKWVKKALNDGANNDSVVLEHYGDILYKLGDKDNAVKYWMDAKSHGSTSKLLDKKIADKKLYE